MTQQDRFVPHLGDRREMTRLLNAVRALRRGDPKRVLFASALDKAVLQELCGIELGVPPLLDEGFITPAELALYRERNPG